MDLLETRNEILEILQNRYKIEGLSFEEENHIYEMKDINGELRNDWKSVSKIIKYFYDEFNSEEIAEKKSKGDENIKQELLSEWNNAGLMAVNLGSRVHYLLEKESLEIFNIQKTVRKPVFDCDFNQIIKSDAMVQAGIEFLNLMKERGAVLLDTEVVLGSSELGITGTADKLWLIENKNKNEIGIIVSDYKSGKPKNFLPNNFTKKMKYPFFYLDDTALGHYSVQLPLYGKLFLKMLEGTKYEKLKIYGCIIVLLKEDSKFEEFRIDRGIINTILSMDFKKYYQ